MAILPHVFLLPQKKRLSDRSISPYTDYFLSNHTNTQQPPSPRGAFSAASRKCIIASICIIIKTVFALPFTESAEFMTPLKTFCEKSLL